MSEVYISNVAFDRALSGCGTRWASRVVPIIVFSSRGQPVELTVTLVQSLVARVRQETEALCATYPEIRDEMTRFFIPLADGRWAPSPEFFSLTSPHPGAHS